MTDNWDDFESKRKNFENKFLETPFNDSLLLVRALSRKDKWETTKCQELKEIGYFNGLDTIGDKLLDFIIIDHFASDRNLTPEQINKYRVDYGNNKILHKFSKEWMSLQNFVIWGNEEQKEKRWEITNTVILAHSFEALVGAIYLDKKLDGLKSYIEKIKFFERIDRMI